MVQGRDRATEWSPDQILDRLHHLLEEVARHQPRLQHGEEEQYLHYTLAQLVFVLSIFHHGVSCRPAEYRLCSDRVPEQRSLAAVDREVRFSAADGNIYRLRHRHSAATRPRVDISRHSDLHRNKTQHIVTNGAVVFCQNVPKLLVSHIGVIFPICLNQVTNITSKIRFDIYNITL